MLNNIKTLNEIRKMAKNNGIAMEDVTPELLRDWKFISEMDYIAITSTDENRGVAMGNAVKQFLDGDKYNTVSLSDY